MIRKPEKVDDIILMKFWSVSDILHKTNGFTRFIKNWVIYIHFLDFSVSEFDRNMTKRGPKIHQNVF